jgi:hypothetical protein
MYERNRVRKSLSRISEKDKEAQVKNIQKFNKSHSTERKHINDYYQLWEHQNFNTKLFGSFTSRHKTYILYRFLREHDIHNVSLNKIKLIIQFLDATSKKNKLRLGNGIFLQRDNHLIKLSDRI